ncbi:MAG: biotin--[acetyl-CoA-carboxylase] ligase [Gemmataceae bacterium]|nr:biotin--[acetyl-CoA-carboxylase] ligase [Gemmataceae bacterium]
MSAIREAGRLFLDIVDGMSESFPIRDVWETGLLHLGRRVVVLRRADSTNARALEAASHAGSAGLAYLADEQDAGRGQHGRKWLAAPGASVLLSVLVPLERPAILTALAAVCVAKLAQELTGIVPRIKWPNDVLLAGRKVAGILIERADGPAVIGIGLNVRQSLDDFRAAGLPDACSLNAMGAQARTEDVARRLLHLLDEEYSRLQGGTEPLEAAWRDGLALLGRKVVAESAGGNCSGVAVGIGFGGIVLREGGTTRTLAPESILHLTAAES